MNGKQARALRKAKKASKAHKRAYNQANQHQRALISYMCEVDRFVENLPRGIMDDPLKP